MREAKIGNTVLQTCSSSSDDPEINPGKTRFLSSPSTQNLTYRMCNKQNLLNVSHSYVVEQLDTSAILPVVASCGEPKLLPLCFDMIQLQQLFSQDLSFFFIAQVPIVDCVLFVHSNVFILLVGSSWLRKHQS